MSNKNKGTVIHGWAGTRLYKIWSGMKHRCKSNLRGYEDVGVCEEWQQFEPFRDWALANGYADNLTIDRIDPFGNYEPANCRWIKKAEQARNKRPTGSDPVRKHKPYNKLKSILLDRDINYSELGDLLQISNGSVSAKINGLSDFYVSEMYAICETYGIDICVFLDR